MLATGLGPGSLPFVRNYFGGLSLMGQRYFFFKQTIKCIITNDDKGTEGMLI